MNYTLIEDRAALESLIERFADCDAVIVDTEFMRRDTFYPVAALFQLCFPAQPEVAWLVDPLAIDDCAALNRLFTDVRLVKVLHSPSEDLEVFQKFLGCQPEPLFDTQKAAAFAGLGFGLGYRALVEQVTGLELAKGETRSDWLARPLSDAQLDYAAADVVPLLPVYRHLHERLQRDGRVEWVLEDGAAATAASSGPAPPFYVRIKTAWKLDGRQLAVLRAVCEWREERAQCLDKPRSWILSDKLCLLLAQRKPATADAMRKLPEMPPSVVRKQGEALLDVIAEALALDETQLPEPLPRPLDAEQRNQLKRLKKAAADIARDWQVDVEALLPSRDYELMVRLGSGEAIERPARWLGWRQRELVAPLLAIAGVEG